MSNELELPLANIIASMAKAKPDGEVAKARARFTRASDKIVAICDVSDSMNDPIGALGMSKWDHLQYALADVWASFPGLVVVAFADRVKQVQARELPKAGGELGCGTELGDALEYAAKLRPRKTIIISDGMPNSQMHVEKVALGMTGDIDSIYCGPEGHPGADFLRGLARSTGGVHVTWDGYKSLAGNIRGLLPAPGGSV